MTFFLRFTRLSPLLLLPLSILLLVKTCPAFGGEDHDEGDALLPRVTTQKRQELCEPVDGACSASHNPEDLFGRVSRILTSKPRQSRTIASVLAASPLYVLYLTAVLGEGLAPSLHMSKRTGLVIGIVCGATEAVALGVLTYKMVLPTPSNFNSGRPSTCEFLKKLPYYVPTAALSSVTAYFTWEMVASVCGHSVPAKIFAGLAAFYAWGAELVQRGGCGPRKPSKRKTTGADQPLISDSLLTAFHRTKAGGLLIRGLCVRDFLKLTPQRILTFLCVFLIYTPR